MTKTVPLTATEKRYAAHDIAATRLVQAKYEERRRAQQITARKRRRTRRVAVAWLILLAIVAGIFSLGTLFGWHLGTSHSKTDTPITTAVPAVIHTNTVAAETLDFSIEPPTVSVTEVDASTVIETDGRVLSLELQQVMMEMCEKYDVPYALALALADAESRFDPDAQSGTGDYGLMQINNINFEWLDKLGIDPLTYEGNIEAGVLMLSKALAQCDDYEQALMIYHNGARGAKSLWEKGVYSTNYTQDIMQRYTKWLAVLEG